jgi:hypothetical protein
MRARTIDMDAGVSHSDEIAQLISAAAGLKRVAARPTSDHTRATVDGSHVPLSLSVSAVDVALTTDILPETINSLGVS